MKSGSLIAAVKMFAGVFLPEGLCGRKWPYMNHMDSLSIHQELRGFECKITILILLLI